MDTVTATELHDRTSELTEQAMADPEQPIVVEKHGKPAVVLVDARYFEGLLETLDLLSDPKAMKLLRRGLDDERAGRLIPHEQLMKELGLDGKAPRRRSSVDPKRRRVPAQIGSRTIQQKIRDKVENLAASGEPELLGKPLVDELQGLYRISFGRYRIIYRVIRDPRNPAAIRIVIRVILTGIRKHGDKRDVYERLRRMLRRGEL